MDDVSKRDEETKLVIELGKSFMQQMSQVEPNWNKAYFRFVAQDIGNGCNASYVHGSEVELLDLRENESFVDEMMEQSNRLAELSGKKKFVMLLSVNSDANYKFHFDYEDLERWKITKQDGRTGIPAGM